MDRRHARTNYVRALKYSDTKKESNASGNCLESVHGPLNPLWRWSNAIVVVRPFPVKRSRIGPFRRAPDVVRESPTCPGTAQPDPASRPWTSVVPVNITRVTRCCRIVLSRDRPVIRSAMLPITWRKARQLLKASIFGGWSLCFNF